MNIIRISGDEAVGIVDRIFSMKNGKKLSDMPTHTIHYGHIKDGDEVIDEVMVVLMRAPKSYTKEDTVEIDCHGGVYVMKRVLELAFTSDDGSVKGTIKINGWDGAGFKVTETSGEAVFSAGEEVNFPFAF